VSGIRHLYVHLPFCRHRCGYCDFVTTVGRPGEHLPYVEALLAELERERHVLAPRLDTVFVGGGTPTFTQAAALEHLLEHLPAAAEVTVEANPETVDAGVARLLRRAGVTRVSVGAQSFQPSLLRVLERHAGPEDVRRAVYALRDAGFDNISLDLLYGIPGQGTADLADDLAQAVALRPEHLSCYELEAKPGTRFTHAWGAELHHQAEAMEDYFERVVDGLTEAGYRWYETANFCRKPEAAGGRDLRSRHNLGYWHGCDYLGLGIGAVSTLGEIRRRNTPSSARYVGALQRGEDPGREVEALTGDTKARERVLLGLRLDEALPLAGLEGALDGAAVTRLAAAGLVELSSANGTGAAVTLTRRGRFLGGAVTAELLAG
jgi:oxygen-independent coproporphyrinogen-3 oxidase